MAVTGTRRAEPASPRTANLAAVLRALRGGPLSRTQLAARCGIAKSAVPGLLTDLAGRGLVRAAGVLPGNGRPSRLVELHGEGAYALALSIEADRLSAVATDLAGRVLAERAETVDVAALGLQRGMDELAHLAREVLPGAPVGVAISVPGLVDSAAAVLRLASALRWRDAEIAGLMAARLNVPAEAVAVDNDANLGALAESLDGAEDLFYLSGGTTVGGGLVSAGTILRGARGFAGEVGHIAVDPVGERCACGRTGCLETKANLAAVLRAAAPPGDPLHDPALGV
ncbi:ROK family transcriptional regulator, partial [Amycolatopsis sp. SID8362]|uniref:ROK family transcriptional regulator n=1 Tax=Amycolatopsis sp. SID8362 TaxID=2690346 RepID=UPI0013696F87